MKKECVSRSFKLKQNTGSLSRAVSWINFSSLSRQTKRLFRSDGELSSMCVQQVDEDDENWTYRSQHRKGDSLFLIPPVGTAACQLVPGQCPCPGPAGSPELLARELQGGGRRRMRRAARNRDIALPCQVFLGLKLWKLMVISWKNL